MPDPITPMGSPGMGQLAPQAPSVPINSGASTVPQPNVGPIPSSVSSSVDAGRAAGIQQVAAQAATKGAQALDKSKKTKEDERTPSLEEAAKTLKEYLKNLPSDLQFRKDEETGTVVFKVVNPLTKEVIREFPPKEIVEMSKRLRHLSEQTEKSGILLDTQT